MKIEQAIPVGVFFVILGLIVLIVLADIFIRLVNMQSGYDFWGHRK